MELYRELLNLVDALDRCGVDYALCGGIAVAFHGHARLTKDIDVLVPVAELAAALEAAGRCGFSVGGGRLTFRKGQDDELTIHRVSKTASNEILTLDLILVSPALGGVWADRGAFEWQGRRVKVVSLAGLAAMKRISGRHQDLADLENLGIEDLEPKKRTQKTGRSKKKKRR
jgi:hypothetical protein